MSGQIDKRFRPLVKQLLEIPGIEVRPPRRGNNHAKIYYRDRFVGTLPSSSSCRFGPKNAVRQLRQHGVPI